MENFNKNSGIEEINIKDILFKYLDYWKWFLVGIILSLFVAYTYIRYKNEIFQTTAKIKILDNSKGGMKLPSDVAALFSNSKVNLDNEIEVIKSHRLLELVARNLNLGTSYYSVGNIKTSELWKNKPFRVIWLDVKDSIYERSNSLEIALQPNGYKLISKVKSSDILYKYGQKNKINGQEFILQLEENISVYNNGNDHFKVSRTPLSIVVQGLSNSIQLASTAKQSEVLSLELTGENKDKSEAIINEIIDSGSEPIIRIIKNELTEHEAYTLENIIITNLNNLTNIAGGKSNKTDYISNNKSSTLEYDKNKFDSDFSSEELVSNFLETLKPVNELLLVEE